MPAARDNGTYGPPRKVRPKAAPKPTGVFGGVKPATAPIVRAQTQARQKTQRATVKVERNVAVPYVPKLAHPTAKQRSKANAQVGQSLHRQGVSTQAQVDALPQRERQRVNRAEGYARTNTRRHPGTRVAFKQGDLHHRVGGGSATIDASVLGDWLASHVHLKGNPVSAFVHGNQELFKHGGIAGRALQDAVDLPANTATSTYLVGKAAVTGHPGRAVKMLADPIVHTVEHPVKSFEQHPLNTVLIFRGLKGAVGHGAGRVMRAVPSDTTRRLASTERAPKTIPGVRANVGRQYSKDPSSKAVQVAVERAKTRRAVRKGKPAPTLATAKDIRRRIDEDVQAAKLVTAQHQAEASQKAADAIGYTRKGRRANKVDRPTAATSLVAQGITTSSRADLAKYRGELVARAGKLKGEDLKRNQQTVRLIDDALKHHDPAAVDRAARAYQQAARGLEPKLTARNIVDPVAAEEARHAAVKARRVPRGSTAPTKAIRRNANKVLKQARIEADRADAQYRTVLAEARASRTASGGVPPVQHDALMKAIDRRDTAQAALEQAQHARTVADIAHTRAHMTPGEEPAFVSHQPIAPRAAAIPLNRPRVPVTVNRTGQAVKRGTLDVHPAKLVEQARGTQRLIDAAGARNRMLDDFGYRGRDASKPVRSFVSKKGAEAFARDKLSDRTGMGWEAVKREDGQYSLIPKHAAQQLRAHADKVQSNHPLARAMGAQWRRNVLAFSPRWFFGNQLEGALRSVIAQAGPTSYATAKRSLKQLSPAEREQALARTVGGGQYRSANRVAHERNIARDAQDLGRMARAVQKLQSTRTVHALSDAYGAYTDIVFRSLNGRLENQFQTAMLGKALRDHPLMSGHVVGLSRNAVLDAADGLRDTNTLAELGREVDRMYGQYGKFSPGMQEMIANYTPFIAWTRNATIFLAKTMPVDHPVLTGLIAASNQATEAWRKQHGLYLDALGRTSGQLPAWLQGSIPGSGGSHLRVSRYTPFGLIDAEGAPVVSQLQGLLLPQLSEIVKNANGQDWTGVDLSKNPNAARDLLAATASFVEGMVPLASQAVSVTGARMPNMRDTTKIEPSMGTRARATFDPFRYTPAKKKVTRASSSSSSGSSAPHISWGDGGGTVKWNDGSSSSSGGGSITWGG